ncbi:MAG: hypothetical protein P1U61_04880 [Legionellaceae bacterium]|nr:hypothetical protein [Legionellaceae bacterium]
MFSQPKFNGSFKSPIAGFDASRFDAAARSKPQLSIDALSSISSHASSIVKNKPTLDEAELRKLVAETRILQAGDDRVHEVNREISTSPETLTRSIFSSLLFQNLPGKLPSSDNQDIADVMEPLLEETCSDNEREDSVEDVSIVGNIAFDGKAGSNQPIPLEEVPPQKKLRKSVFAEILSTVATVQSYAKEERASGGLEEVFPEESVVEQVVVERPEEKSVETESIEADLSQEQFAMPSATLFIRDIDITQLSQFARPIDACLTEEGDNPLNTYLSSLKHLKYYAVSPVESDFIDKAIDEFEVLAKQTQIIANTLMQAQDKKVSLKLIQANLKIFAEHLNLIDTFNLEGQNKAYSGEPLKRGVLGGLVYHLACFFRAVFNVVSYVLTLGQLSSRNLLSEKMGFGRFFIQKPMAEAEKEDVRMQVISLEVLLETVKTTEDVINRLLEEQMPSDNDKESTIELGF